MGREVGMMDTELGLWHDGNDELKQLISDSDKRVLYERHKGTETFRCSTGASVTVAGWGPWVKVKQPCRMGKAWFMRNLTVDDLVLGNFTEDKG